MYHTSSREYLGGILLLSLELRLRHFRNGLDLKCRAGRSKLVGTSSGSKVSSRTAGSCILRIPDCHTSSTPCRCHSLDPVATNACPNPAVGWAGRITSTGASRARCPARFTRRSGWCQIPSSTLSFESISAYQGRMLAFKRQCVLAGSSIERAAAMLED